MTLPVCNSILNSQSPKPLFCIHMFLIFMHLFKFSNSSWSLQKEREAFEVIVEGGKLVYRQAGILINTTEDTKWIFVLSTSRSLYVGQKNKGVFQHSSFLAGAATTAAGRLVAQDGVLQAIWPYSGHYLPNEDNFKEFISFLEEHNVDLTNVKVIKIFNTKDLLVIALL